MRRQISFAGYKIGVPESRILRLLLGVALILGGLFGFLPVFGFWMVTLGLAVLSTDVPIMRRLWVKIRNWWARRGVLSPRQLLPRVTTSERCPEQPRNSNET